MVIHPITADARLDQGDLSTDRSRYDIAVIGGGPAGLATAIVAAAAGRSVIVLERRGFAADKACGEGVLPPGVEALRRLGVLAHLDDTEVRSFRGIHFFQEDGSSVEVPLPQGGGLGIRRTTLLKALTQRAQQLGVAVRYATNVTNIKVEKDGAILRTAGPAVHASLVVAADGLHSLFRRGAGLHCVSSLPRRFALRQHFLTTPWSESVEVYVDAFGEAVVTPVTADTVSVNFTWQDGAFYRPTIPTLLTRFPLLNTRLQDAEPISMPKGAGPMACGVSRRVAERFVLIGDAAGFVDSIAGDGLSIAFNSALILGRHLSALLQANSSEKSLEPYEREAHRLFRGYAIATKAMLFLARRPGTRRRVIHYLSRRRRLTGTIARIAMAMMATAS
ncbi:MAG TPA: NAD(P)/FAD-dependent oxidoreductase [Candidatus Binataceae bacterium]|nr:NAD(P)/FAD-dependent oxidoreductase [Candidatus Binataceae bacterium]